MISVPKLISRLYGVVGSRQPLNPDYSILDADNQISRSGYYVTDIPNAKIEYLKDTQDYKDASDAEFNEFLKQIQEEAIVNTCNEVFMENDYLDRQVLYRFPNNKVTLETLPDGFVGFKIEVESSKNIAFEISRVILDFDGTGDIELLLYDSGQKAPLFTEVVTINTDNQEVILNWVVDNTGSTYKGEYYLGYVSTGITVTPYKREYENANIQSQITSLYIERTQVPNFTGGDIFDLESTSQKDVWSGLNPDITVYEDFTDLAFQNERILARAIQMNMAISFIETYLNSLRSNNNQRRSTKQAELVIQLEGQDEDGYAKVSGLKTRLLGQLAMVKKEIKRRRTGYFGQKLKTVTNGSGTKRYSYRLR